MAHTHNISFNSADHTHSLGQYQAWRLPQNDAATPIDMIWISAATAENPTPHRVLPHGEPSLAIRRRRDRTGAINNIDLTVCGPFHKPIWYRPEPREELIAVRLKPEMAADVFGIAPYEYRDEPPTPPPANLARICGGALNSAEKESLAQVAHHLVFDLQHYAADKDFTAHPEIAAAGIIRQAAGQIRCARLAQELEISDRHLRRRFQDRLGCSPKDYARQIRLTAMVMAAETQSTPDWATLAIDAGFHDQAHMINEIRSILDLTPQTLHRERRALAG